MVIGWQGVIYNISVKRDATILDLKNRTVEMLGLEGNFFVKYGEMEVSGEETAFKYILCNNLKLERLKEFTTPALK